jgi:hypothetical protein
MSAAVKKKVVFLELPRSGFAAENGAATGKT